MAVGQSLPCKIRGHGGCWATLPRNVIEQLQCFPGHHHPRMIDPVFHRVSLKESPWQVALQRLPGNGDVSPLSPIAGKEHPLQISLLLVPGLGALSCVHGSAANSQGQFKVVVGSSLLFIY